MGGANNGGSARAVVDLVVSVLAVQRCHCKGVSYLRWYSNPEAEYIQAIAALGGWDGPWLGNQQGLQAGC